MKNKLGLVMIVAILATVFACDSKKQGETASNDSTAVKSDSTVVANDSTKVDSTKAK